MTHSISETLQLIEKFLLILKEAGMLKSYYLNFCYSSFKSDDSFIPTFQPLIDNLKDVFFKICNKWQSLQNIQYEEKVHNHLILDYESNQTSYQSSFDKKSPEHCMINDKVINNVISSCSLPNHPVINSNIEFNARSSNKIDHCLKSHDSMNNDKVLENVCFSDALGQVNCQDSNQSGRNNLNPFNSYNDVNQSQGVSNDDSSSSTENVHFHSEFSQLDSLNQSHHINCQASNPTVRNNLNRYEPYDSVDHSQNISDDSSSPPGNVHYHSEFSQLDHVDGTGHTSCRKSNQVSRNNLNPYNSYDTVDAGRNISNDDSSSSENVHLPLEYNIELGNSNQPNHLSRQKSNKSIQNNINIHDSFNTSSTNQNISNNETSSLEFIHFSRVFSQLDSLNQSDPVGCQESNQTSTNNLNSLNSFDTSNINQSSSTNNLSSLEHVNFPAVYSQLDSTNHTRQVNCQKSNQSTRTDVHLHNSYDCTSTNQNASDNDNSSLEPAHFPGVYAQLESVNQLNDVSCQELSQSARNNLNHLDAFDNSSTSQNSGNNGTSLESVLFPRGYGHLDRESQANISNGNAALNNVLSLSKEFGQIESSVSQNPSCMHGHENNLLDNVSSLSNTLSSSENVNKIESTIIGRGSILTEVVPCNHAQQVNSQLVQVNSSDHTDYTDEALEINALEREGSFGRNLNFPSANQSTVDTSILDSSSADFTSFYATEKSSVTEKPETQLYVISLEEKSDTCLYNKSIPEEIQIEAKEQKLTEHFRELGEGRKKCFECVHCSQSFSRLESVTSHLAETHEILSSHLYSCDQCGKTFSKKYSLRLHIESFHDGVKQFECHICSKRFSQKVVRDTHLASHTGVYQYGCDECGKRFAAKNKLKFHLLSHEDPQFKCDVCNKLFTTNQYLQNHLKTHGSTAPEEIEVCELCSVVCKNREALLKHKRYKHRKALNFCDFPGCTKSFVTQTMLQRHQDRLHNVNKKMYQCQECDRTFSQEKSLQHHTKQNHTIGLSEEQLRPFQCSVCNKRYAFPNKLKLHMMTHTQEPQHCCNLCTKTFYRLDLLKMHMASKHFYADQMGFPKSHVCDICGQSFSTKFTLKTHQALHSQNSEDTSSFDCMHCKKAFKSKLALDYHLKKHEGKFSHECRYCSKKFVRKCHLDDHLQTHMSERNFKCNLCKASFKRNKHVREHLKRVHPNHITVDTLLESITSESNDQQNLLPAIKEELRISLATL